MARPRSILVVDDDNAMAEMLAALLEDDGIRALPVGTAKAAVDALRHGDFGVVLSDIQMPAMDGFALLRAVRSLRPGTPVVLMTAFGDRRGAELALDAGAFDYLSKPFARDRLREVVGRALAA